MLESLKNNHIFSPQKGKKYESPLKDNTDDSPQKLNSTQSDIELKKKFDSLLYNLQTEFNSMLEAR
jgi:hypothetical protein